MLFLQKSGSTRKRVSAGAYAGFLMATVARGQYGNGGARATGVWRLFMDQVDLMDLMDNVGAP